MDFNPTDVRLPVRQIRDANLPGGWIRLDAEPQDDNDELLVSLDREGMLLPILLTGELVVADGARRFLRAERLGWREVPVVVTTDWDVVRRYLAAARKLEADGASHDPMTWAETADLVEGPLEVLYRDRLMEKWRASREIARRTGVPGTKNGSNKRQTDYTAEVAEALNWGNSDLRYVRMIHRKLAELEAREAAGRKAALQGGDTEAAERLPRYAPMLRDEILQFEKERGVEDGGLSTFLKKVKWILSSGDLGDLKTGRARRQVGEPTVVERKAALAADSTATGRDLDAQTMARLTQVLMNLSNEFDAYTHLRPSVRSEDARTAAKNMKTAVNKINRLTRLMRAHADYLERSS